MLIHLSETWGILVSTCSSKGVRRSQTRIKKRNMISMIHTTQSSPAKEINKMTVVKEVGEILT